MKKSKDVKTWNERCEEHPDHNGVVSNGMIHQRMNEEIDELRELVEELEVKDEALKLIAWLDEGLGAFYWDVEFRHRPVPPGFVPVYKYVKGE